MSEATDKLRADHEALIGELEAAGAHFTGNSCRCPFHEDKHASAGIYETGGVWRFKCQVPTCGFCGDIFDVRARVAKRPVEDILRAESANNRPPDAISSPATPKAERVFASFDDVERAIPGQVEGRYTYTNPDDDAVDMLVVRFRKAGEGKRFFQYKPHPAGGFTFGAPPKPWPIYRRDLLRHDSLAIVTEGEKSSDVLNALGIIATTSPGGSGNASNADWSPLGGKSVFLWPDFDEAGEKYMSEVAGLLDRLKDPPTVHWIEPTAIGVPLKGDAYDFLEQRAGESDDFKRAAIFALLDNAEPLGASRDVGTLIEDTISGKRKAILWPWCKVGKLAKALLPGTLTIVCGPPGATKSFWLLEALAHWHKEEIPVAVFELEEDRAYHLLRSLAQQSGESGMTNDEWVKNNPRLAREHYKEHQSFLDSFGRRIWAAPDKQVTLDALAEWVIARAKEGSRIIAIDPVTIATTNDKPWIADGRFLVACKTAVREYNASLILVTHPVKGTKGKADLDSLAGGAAYGRFSQTIFWLEYHSQPRDVEVMGVNESMGISVSQKQSVTINRTLHMSKTRNGIGQGLAIGFKFHKATLCSEEIGVIIK